MIVEQVQDLEPAVQRLNKDLREAARRLTPREARYMVDAYYTVQEYRKAFSNQVRASAEAGEPSQVLEWFLTQAGTLEEQIKRALDAWTDEHQVGRWAKSIYGIGPVISAGLLAHIDIHRAPTVGHIWRFAGLDPTIEWKSGQKRPWNAGLKTLCWKIGQSFMKFSNRPECVHGRLYRERKAQETERNERGEYAEQAARILAAKRIGKDTEAYRWYSQGKLPPAHIDARARRWVVKLFLSQWHYVAYEVEFGTPPPKPYVIEHLGHTHLIPPPNWPMR